MPPEPTAFHHLAVQAADLDQLNASFRREVRTHGFTAFAAGQLTPARPGRPFLLFDWPRAWLDLYAARGFASKDIAIASALRSPEPVTWTELRKRGLGPSAEIFAAAAEFGWHEGFTIPVHGPGDARGIVSLAGPKMSLSAEVLRSIEASALTAYERALELAGDRKPAPDPLTPREEEVLVLVAKGQADAQNGQALGISKATAHFHVESAKRKLGAITRAHAVAVALTRGMILV